MSKFLLFKWVRMLVVLFNMLQISLVNLLSILSNFLMFGLKKGVA